MLLLQITAEIADFRKLYVMTHKCQRDLRKFLRQITTWQNIFLHFASNLGRLSAKLFPQITSEIGFRQPIIGNKLHESQKTHI